MKKFPSVVILLFFAQFTSAQYQMGLVPRISPDKAVYQKIGFTEIEVSYGSPAVKDREIWGGLVPYDKVWRAGANNATTLEVSEEIIINNMPLDSGKYAFFVIPRQTDKWTAIFNKVHKQWGAFKYDEKENALTIDVIPRTVTERADNLTYTIKQLGYQYGSIVLQWGYIEIEIPFETNYLQKFEQEVESRAQNQPDYLKWVVYIQGADHLAQIETKTQLGLSWVEKAEQIMNATDEWNKQFYPRDYVKGHLYWTKAKLFAKIENYPEALKYAQKMKNLKQNLFYERKKDVEEIDARVTVWGAQ